MQYTQISSLAPEWLPYYGGERLVIPSANIVYVSILKNAHSWATQLIVDNFDSNLESKFNSNCKCLIILRDPVQRWVSGFTQYFSKFPLDHIELLDNPMFHEVMFDTLEFDTHMKLQLMYFSDLYLENCVFFNTSDNLERNLTHYLSKFTENPIKTNTNYHEGSSHHFKIEISEKLNKILTCGRFREKLLNFTKHDRMFMQYVTDNNLWYKAP